MKAKTEYSRNVLAGLTEGDFAKMAGYCQVFEDLQATWKSWIEPTYQATSNKSCSLWPPTNLIPPGRQESLGGHLLAFNQLTVSCVQCHQLVRKVTKADFIRAPRFGSNLRYSVVVAGSPHGRPVVGDLMRQIKLPESSKNNRVARAAHCG